MNCLQLGVLARLRHPNVVDHVGTVLHPFLMAHVFELVPRGYTLFDLLHSHFSFDPKLLLSIARDIARGAFMQQLAKS
jgi:hypothetical protein